MTREIDPLALLDVETKVLLDIAARGQSIISVFPTASTPEKERFTFAYTAGRCTSNQPDILITGLDPETSGGLLDMMRGKSVELGHDVFDVLANDYPARFIEADMRAAGMSMAWRVARDLGMHVRGVQMIWPDQNGKFPGEGWSLDDRMQPLFPKR